MATFVALVMNIWVDVSGSDQNRSASVTHERLGEGRGDRPRLAPIDHARDFPGLPRALNRLRAAVAAQSVHALRPLIGPTVSVDFERGYSPDEFVAYIGSLPVEDRRRLWRNLRDAVSLGAARAPGPSGGVLLPYTAALAAGMCSDVITAARVALRAAPTRDAAVLDHLSYECVDEDEAVATRDAPPLLIDGFEYRWTPVVTSAGHRGWVSSKYFRGFLSFRVLLQQIDGEWKITAIAEGD